MSGRGEVAAPLPGVDDPGAVVLPEEPSQSFIAVSEPLRAPPLLWPVAAPALEPLRVFGKFDGARPGPQSL